MTNIEFEYIANDGKNYFIEACGYMRREEFGDYLETVIDDYYIYDNDGNNVKDSLENEIKEEIEDAIYSKEFDDSYNF